MANDDIDKPCPSCGLVGVWMCTSRDCPMKDGQKAARESWQNRQNGNESEVQ